MRLLVRVRIVNGLTLELVNAPRGADFVFREKHSEDRINQGGLCKL